MDKIKSKLIVTLTILITLLISFQCISLATDDNTDNPDEEIYAFGSQGGDGGTGGAGVESFNSGAEGLGQMGLICIEKDVFMPFETYTAYNQWLSLIHI